MIRLRQITMTHSTQVRAWAVSSLSSGLLGITLLLPASYFMLTMTARVFGAKSLYYYIAPSFLQSPFHLFAFHKAQIILFSLILAILFNLRYRRRNWFNMAVAFQGLLLLVVLVCYTLIQHLRY